MGRHQMGSSPVEADAGGGKQRNIFVRIIRFYYDGFRSMTLGRTLWAIILVKLAIMFLILKIFFFPNFLKSHFSDDASRTDYVLEELTTIKE